MNRVTYEEIGEVFQKRYGYFLNYALRLSKDKDVAKDIVSEVFSRAIENPPVLTEDKTLKNYLADKVRFRFLDICVRSKYNSMKLPTSHLEVGDLEEFLGSRMNEFNPYEENEISQERDERKNRLSSAMKKMTKCRREVFQYKMEGLTVKEIAEKLRSSEGAVKMNLSRAYSSLRKSLAKEGIIWDGKVPLVPGESYSKSRFGKKRKAS